MSALAASRTDVQQFFCSPKPSTQVRVPGDRPEMNAFRCDLQPPEKLFFICGETLRSLIHRVMLRGALPSGQGVTRMAALSKPANR